MKFTRIKVRKIINEFKDNGLSKDKLILTLKNLRKSNYALSFYVEKNKKKQNTFFNKDKKELILNKNFFDQPHEVLFRSMSIQLNLLEINIMPQEAKKLIIF